MFTVAILFKVKAFVDVNHSCYKSSIHSQQKPLKYNSTFTKQVSESFRSKN